MYLLLTVHAQLSMQNDSVFLLNNVLKTCPSSMNFSFHGENPAMATFNVCTLKHRLQFFYLHRVICVLVILCIGLEIINVNSWQAADK